MIKGKTESGFEFQIPEGLGKDVLFLRTVRDFYKAEKTNDQEKLLDCALDLPVLVVGSSEEEERLYKHIKAIHGTVPIDVLFRELTQMIEAASAEERAVKN